MKSSQFREGSLGLAAAVLGKFRAFLDSTAVDRWQELFAKYGDFSVVVSSPFIRPDSHQHPRDESWL